MIKVQKVANGWVTKLNNQMIQLIIDENNYLLWGKKVWDVSTLKEKELSMKKLKKGEVRGNSEHLKLLSKIA